MTGLVSTPSEAAGIWSSSPLIVNLDSFSLWIWASKQTAYHSLNAWNHNWESFMVDTESYQTIWSFPLTNVKWHSVTWPYTMTNHYWSDLIPYSIEHLRRFLAWRQGTLTSPGTGSRPFGTCIILFYLLRSFLFSILLLFFRTMLFEYPLVLSRFCLMDV